MDKKEFDAWIFKNVAITYALRGVETPKPEIINFIVAELMNHSQNKLESAFNKLRLGKGVLSFGEIVGSIEDDRPSALEAWSMSNKSEYESYCSNQEIDEAMEVALVLTRQRYIVNALTHRS